MTRWQPIETAPRDGTEILAWQADESGLHQPSGYYTLVRWDGRGFSDAESYGSGSTHWMPLPRGPHAQAED
jgi:hypothetical protein